MKKILKSIVDTGLFILIVLLATYFVVHYVAQRTIVHNVSMQETLYEGDNLITDKLSYHFREPRRFEIICFSSKSEPQDLIKRIIGLPFETVRIQNGEFYINGEKLADVQGLEPPLYGGRADYEIQLAEDEYFVVGDNRAESIDSRYDEIGNVRRDAIIGRAWFRIYPFQRFGSISP